MMTSEVLVVVVVTCFLWGVGEFTPTEEREEAPWPHPQADRPHPQAGGREALPDGGRRAGGKLSLHDILGLADEGADWGYEDHNGPDTWSTSHPECGGSHQSPVNVVRDAAVLNTSIGAFTFGGHYSTGYDSLIYTVINNGHSLKLYFGGAPQFTLSGAGLAGSWALEQLHIHWGSSDTVGSEHTLDGETFPGEVHLVHYNTAYTDFTAALSHPDGLAVLSFMLEIDDLADNPGIRALINSASSVPYSGDTTSILPFSVRSMLPPDQELLGFYRYQGSLTTPPCSEIVSWSLFSYARLKVTTAQINILRTALSMHDNTHTKSPIVNNYRPILPLNGRMVQLSGASATLATQPLLLSSLLSLIRNQL